MYTRTAMDYKGALEKLEALRVALENYKANRFSSRTKQFENLCALYGEMEEVICRFAGISNIEVPGIVGSKPNIYPNFIEAALSTSHYLPEGYTQLLKVIGRVRQAAADPHAPSAPPTVTALVQNLGRFRECCQYIEAPPRNEQEVRDILWIMLRSQYDRVDRETALPQFGGRPYRPDFGIPDLQTLVEVKFIGTKSDTAAIQKEILADVPAYLAEPSGFTCIIELVYDHARKLGDPRKFIDDLRKVDGIVEVIVVPGISR